jgi:hypothetical protein
MAIREVPHGHPVAGQSDAGYGYIAYTIAEFRYKLSVCR